VNSIDDLGADILALLAVPCRRLRMVYVQYIRPGCLRVLWDNPLNDKQYPDANFLLRIARRGDGRNTGTTP
jgi:hypothetical protein